MTAVKQSKIIKTLLWSVQDQENTDEYRGITSKMCVLCAEMLQSCLTLQIMDCSPPGSSFQLIFRAEY